MAAWLNSIRVLLSAHIKSVESKFKSKKAAIAAFLIERNEM